MTLISNCTKFLDTTPCGCEVDGEAFCNFDYGATGFCESCSSYASANDCRNDGLPYAGVADCITRCGFVKQGGNQYHY